MNEEHPDLIALLRGELGNADAVEAADHARTCPRCHAELVDDALGHGLLTRARRTLGASDPETVAVSAPVALLSGRAADHAPDPTTAHTPDSIADPTGALAAEQRLGARAGGRGRARPFLVGAATVAVLAAGAGLGLAGAALVGDDGSPPAAVAEQTATLEPVEGSATGTVAMGTAHDVTRMRLATKSLPSAPRGEFYYAWLFDPRTKKMLPLGQVTPGHVATFEIPESLVEAYSAVDVSLEADDGNPGHSVTSVLRAAYADPAKALS